MSGHAVQEGGCGRLYGLTKRQFDECDSHDDMIKAVVKAHPDVKWQSIKVRWLTRHWSDEECYCVWCRPDEHFDDSEFGYTEKCMSCTVDLTQDDIDGYEKLCTDCRTLTKCEFCGMVLDVYGKCPVNDMTYDHDVEFMVLGEAQDPTPWDDDDETDSSDDEDEDEDDDEEEEVPVDKTKKRQFVVVVDDDESDDDESDDDCVFLYMKPSPTKRQHGDVLVVE